MENETPISWIQKNGYLYLVSALNRINCCKQSQMNSPNGD